MATHQNTSVDADRIMLGNFKLETAASAAATFVNMGAGMLTSFVHNFEKFTVQAGNAPDPLEGIATETVQFGFDLLEYDASVLSALSNGLLTSSGITSVASTLEAGGQTVLTKRAYKLTNNTTAPSGTATTIITIFQGTIDNGMTLVTKSDNDTDPMNAYQFTVTGELDSTRTVGSQLFSISKTEV